MIKILRGFSKSRFLFGQKKKGTSKICWLSLFPLSLLVQKNQPKIDLKLSIIFYRYSRKSFNCRLPKRFFSAQKRINLKRCKSRSWFKYLLPEEDAVFEIGVKIFLRFQFSRLYYLQIQLIPGRYLDEALWGARGFQSD